MHNDVELTGPVIGFIQFMRYTDIDRQTATPLFEPIWVDMKSLMARDYEYRTKLSIAWPATAEPIDYVVAMIPLIGYTPHPDDPEKSVLRKLVYLVDESVWPLLDKLDDPDKIDVSMFPR